MVIAFGISSTGFTLQFNLYVRGYDFISFPEWFNQIIESEILSIQV